MAKISLEQYSAHMNKLKGGFMTAVNRGLMSGLHRAVTVAHRLTREAPPANPSGIGSGGAVNRGSLLASWKSEKTQLGGRLYNTQNYSAVVEYGRRAGARMPPTAALASWAKRRLGLSTKEAKSAAFAIAKAIQKRGLLPRKIITGAASGEPKPEIMRVVLEEIKRELDEALKVTQ